MSDQSSGKLKIKNLLEQLLQTEIGEELFTYKEFIEFMNSERVLYLKISYLPGSKKLVLTTPSSQPLLSNESERSVSLLKLESRELQFNDLLSHVNVVLRQESFSRLLASEVSVDILPLIKRSDPSMSSFIENFLGQVRGIERKIREEGMKRKEISENDWGMILTPLEEIEFWKDYSNINQKDERILKIYQYFSKLERFFIDTFVIEPLKLSDILNEIFGSVEDIIQNIKNKEVNKERLKHFLILSLEHFANKINFQFLKNTDFSKESLGIYNCIQDSFENVKLSIERMNQLYFKTNPLIIKGTYFEKILISLSSILSLSSLLSSLEKLLTPASYENLSSHVSTSTPEEALALVDATLENEASTICSKIEEDYFVPGNHILMILRDLGKISSALKRNSLRTRTKNKREEVMVKTKEYVGELIKSYESKEKQTDLMNDDEINEKLNDKNIIGLSPKMSLIICVHNIKQKLLNIYELSKNILDDLEDYPKLVNSIKEYAKRINQFIVNNINDWQDNNGHLKEELKNNHNELIEIDKKTGFLKVNFSEKLFQLIQDIRLLSEYGYHKYINKEIMIIKDEGKKKLNNAIVLKQIANFYNNLSNQIIPCQKPMLIKNAKEFEQNLINESNKYKNNEENDLENYVITVQSAANSLTEKLKKLKKAHGNILDLLCQLFNYDLISNKYKWREIIQRANEIFMEISNDYNNDLSLIGEWLNHWNFQLYKILKIQYKLSIDKFFSFINEFNCEFQIIRKQLILKPSIEEMKKSIYKEINNFINIPITIRNFISKGQITGLGDNPNKPEDSYYQTIIDENQEKVNGIYEHLNKAITKLESIQENFSSIINLSTVDFESYIESSFNSIEDWKDNYELVKEKRRKIEKLSDFHMIDCFRVNLKTFKIYADEAYERVFDVLSSTLVRKIKSNLKGIDEFVNDSMEKLERKATNLEEVVEFKKNFAELNKKKNNEFEKKRKECSEMNKLIFLINGKSLNLSETENRWENLNSMLGKFTEELEEQKKIIKVEQNKKLKELLIKIDEFKSKFSATVPPDNYVPDPGTDISELAKNVKNVYGEWDTLDKEISNVLEEMNNFDLKVETDMSPYDNSKKEVEEKKKRWNLLFEFNEELEKINEKEWLKIRHKAFGIMQDFIMNWNDKLKKLDPHFINSYIKNELQKYKASLQIYKYLIGDNFEKDHWSSLFMLLKFDTKITKETLKFGNFIEKNDTLIEKERAIKELYHRAQGEILIRNAMSELSAWFEMAEFKFIENVNPNTKRRTPLIKDWKELMSEISDKQALLVSVKTSEYFSRFEDQITQYETKFSNLDEWLTNLNLIQRKWVYLEPIFSRGALPKEQPRFKKIDEEFRNIVITLNNGQKVSTIFSVIGISNTLQMLIDQLEKCQKALNDFLEEKRNKFARLYFIGDDDLLEFLANCKDPIVIKNNLNKLYQGITQLEIENNYVNRIIASNNESVKLEKSVIINEELETWLNNLTSVMQSTLNSMLNQIVKEYIKTDIDFSYLDKYPGQLCMLIEMLKFYYRSTKSIKNNSLEQLKKASVDLIQNLTVIQAKSGKDTIKLFKIKNLMLDLIHNREVSEKMSEIKINDVFDWLWFSQLKYFIDPKNMDGKGNLFITMCDGQFLYTFEYQGAGQKLVHTPLTDKCYLTLTQSLRLGYGGNPYGPAGTGKTESVKALGQAFGRQVLVFNCDEGIDFKAMGRIFIGLVKSGAWGCFDEFNRLLEEQLSAISIQIQIIQFALKNKVNQIDLLNLKVQVDYNSAIFVTMNPASKGYGGRSKLPDNLKILFRPVAMSVPDNLQIARTLLYAEGFRHGEALSKKVTTLFTLCKQGLSGQIHYDWGLRSLKTILTVASQQIQLFLNEGKTATYEEETSILIKAIRINVLSKLIFSDSEIFSLLLSDVFPDSNISDIAYENLTAALKESYVTLGLAPSESQSRKVVQFYEACRQRTGVVIVGPSGCGKSTVWKLMRETFNKLNQKIVVHIINPKAMDRKLLLGHMNHDTGEYTYGVLTKCARAIEKEPYNTRCWIICDGDVDPDWIEALNSVLDDNRLLTMQNGERIRFLDNVNFIFETDSLKFASPATVSRMGIIYMNMEDLDVNRIGNNWVNKTLGDKGEVVRNWFNNYFPEIFQNYKDNYKLEMITTNYGSVNNFLSIFTNYFYVNNSKDMINPSTMNKAAFVDAIVKGLGFNLSYENRKKFAMSVYQICGERPNDTSNVLDVYYDNKQNKLINYEYMGVKNIYKNEDNIYGSGDDNEKYIDIKKFKNNGCPLIMTTATQCYLNTLKIWLNSNEPFIAVGPEGVGKNLLISTLISLNRNIKMSVLSCTSQTSSEEVIRKLAQNCSISNTSRGKCMRPRDCQKLVLFLKDINLPKPDKYNTCRLISFLQSLVTYEGFYDENLEFVYLERVQIIAAMSPSSEVGRFEITTRFTGNVRVMYIDYPSNSDLIQIYGEFLKGILSQERFGGEKTSEKYTKFMTNFCVNVYKNVKANFTFDVSPHYSFSPRDLTKWVSGLLGYEIGSEMKLMKAFLYEGLRIFRDKVVGRDNLIKIDKIFTNELSKVKMKLDINAVNDILFTGLIDDHSLLKEISKDDYKDILVKGQMIYERDNDELHMNYFPDTLHISKSLDRLLFRESSNLLLIGSFGSGRKRLLRAVASARGLEIFSLSLSPEFGPREFRKSMKDLIGIVVVENRGAVFLIEKFHIVNKEIMEIVNSIVSSGEISGLFNKEEQEAIFSQITNEFKEQNEYRNIYDFYTSRIKKNLKMCILLDYDDKEFNQFIINNPALIIKCDVIWFNEPSDEFLKQLIFEQLNDSFELLIKNKLLNKDELDNYALNFIKIYKETKSTDNNQPIVSSLGKFTEFLLTYKSLLQSRLHGSSMEREHLRGGLTKLQEAESFVAKLREESDDKKKEIEEKKKQADKSMNEITDAVTESNKKKEELKILNEQINEEKKKVEAHKAQVEEELKGVMPEVEKAQNLVKKIDSGAMAEITVYFRKPVMPQEVYWILKAMLQLIGHDNLNEIQVKSTFNMKAMANLQSFNIRRLSIENAEKIRKYVNNNPNCFNKSSVERVNASLAKISEFVKAVLKYYDIKLKIRPLEQALESAETQLRISQTKVDENEKEIMDIETRVKELKDEFAKLTGEAEVLKAELAKTEDLLLKAASLLSKLAGERDRWKKRIDMLEVENEMIPFNTLLSSGFLTFLGYYNESIREQLYTSWRNSISLGKRENRTETFLKFLLDERETLKLKFEGLPTDALSLENAVIVNNTLRTVLIIDPVTKATEWFKNTLSKKGPKFEICSLHDSKLLTNLELAIRFGKNFLISDVDKIEGFLVPLIRGEKFKRGAGNIMKIGEKVIDVHDNFKLYLCTRDSSIELSNNILNSMNVINFTVTRSGLESILLGLTIDIEQPELEKQKNKLLEEQDKIKLELSEVEKKLLEQLISLEGNLLENKELIESLERSKEKSTQSEKILQKSEEQSKEIDIKRGVYKNLAKKATTIYILLQQLHKINPMYQFSLDNYMQLYKTTIENKRNDESEINDKLKIYQNALIQEAFVYYSRSLFKTDLLVFGLFYVKTIFEDEAENIKEYQNMWNFILGNIDISSANTNNIPNFLPEERKNVYAGLRDIYPNLAELISSNERWFKLDSPEDNMDILSNDLTPMEKILILYVTRPDRMENGLKNLVCSMLNIDTLVPSPMTMKDYLNVNQDNKIPIMFLTTLGSDPSRDLEEFAEKTITRNNYIEIPLGAGDNENIVKILRDAAEKGKWVTLKNIHLAFNWLPTLEKEIKALTKPHEKFRLFLTSETHQKFSPILLQSCIKYTYETPPGIKKNLERIYQQWSSDLLQKITSPEIAQSLFSLAVIHAILQERRTYIPQGWSKFYEFSYGDLKVSAEKMVENLESENGKWENIKGLIKGTFYGGRIDNDFDHKVMCTYIDKILDRDNLSRRGGRILGNSKLPVIVSSNIDDYMDIIKNLPENDNPEMFGLPLNVDRAVQRYVSTQVLMKVNSIYSMGSDLQKFDKVLWTEKLSPLLSMWRGIFNENLMDNLRAKAKKINSKDPVILFIKSEAIQLTELCEIINNGLNDINGALTGSSLLTSHILRSCSDLLQGRVPETWNASWDGPELPASFLRCIGKKLRGLGEYIDSANRKDSNEFLQEINVNLSEFLHPEAFINSLRQKSARESGVPIDELEIICQFSSKKEDGTFAKMTGLFVQGADFDGQKLIDIKGNQNEIVKLPPCLFRFVRNKNKNDNEIAIPLYENIFREHFICTLDFKFAGNLDTIILKGIAICLEQ